MENINEVVANEMDEVVFVAEEIIPKTNTGLKIVGGAVIGAAVGYGIYKGARWLHAKIKAKKAKEEVIIIDEDKCVVEDAAN